MECDISHFIDVEAVDEGSDAFTDDESGDGA
jgi:hypothetical protein